MMRFFTPLLCYFLLSSALLRAQSGAEAAYQEAVAAMNAGQAEKGLDGFARAIQLKPNYYHALYARAYYLNEMGASEESIFACNALLAQYPKDTATYVLRGQAHTALEQFAEARADFEQALSLYPTEFRIYNELANLYFVQEDFEQAREYLQKSLAIKDNASAHEYLARMLNREGKTELALKETDKWMAMEPKNEDALRLKAQIYIAANKESEAIKIYTQLQKEKKLTEQDILNWGLIYYYQKKYPQALTYFSILKKHDEPDLYYFKGLTEFRMRKPEEALKSIDKALALLDPNDEEHASYFYDRAIIKQAITQKKGKNLGAVRDFLHAVYLVPEIIAGVDYNGDTLDLLGNARQVLKGLYTPQQLDSARLSGYQQRAEAFADRRLYKEAVTEVEKALKIDSLQAFSYHLRGSYRSLQEQYAPAIRDYEKALRLPGNPVTDQTHHLRGVAYAALEVFPKAIEDFDQAIALNAQQAEYYYDRAFAYADQGDFKTALRDINRAIELDPEQSEYRISRSGFYNETNQFELALQDCNEVLSKEPDHADALYYRGLAYEGKKNYAQAIQDLTRASTLNPGLEEARQALEVVMLKAGK